MEERDAKVIVIDSLNGYLNAMPEERFLTIQLHELLMYLGQKGVATILIGAHQGLIGSQMTTPVDASYLADAVILLRYFEARGEVRQAISVMKKRGSRHERTLREFRLDEGRISRWRGAARVPRRAHGSAGVWRRCHASRRALVMTDGESAHDLRVLFLAPTARDQVITQALLGPAGVALEGCRTLPALVREIHAGAAAILLPEEAVTGEQHLALHEALAQQPAWSDLPVLILTRTGADSAALGHAVRTLGNVTLLERPLRQATLLSAVQTAVRARTRQYQIREHLAERSRAEASLRMADRRKDEFLATLGHELRNPLAPLLTALQLLKASSIEHPVVVRVSGVMERQVAHLVRLVDDLLEVSRITRGLIEVHREQLDLGFVVHSAIDTSRPIVDGAGHQLTVDIPDEPLTVFGDAVRLTQVFANLLTNAAKYTNANGLIEIRVTREAGRAVVSIRDNGIGIADDQLGSVFEMFTQVDRAEPTRSGWTRHWPDAGAQPGRDARWARGGSQRRARAGQ